MNKPLVFIPGHPGSELHRAATGERVFPPSPAQLTSARKADALRALYGPTPAGLDDGIIPADVVRHQLVWMNVRLLKEMETLLQYVRSLGYRQGGNFVTVPWDWRRPIDHPATQRAAADAIRQLADRTGQPVVVMAHSTGGLILRLLLETSAETCIRVEHVIALGVPWAGTLKPLRVLRDGQPFPCNLITRQESSEIISHSWAAYDLMPPDPARTDMSDADGPLNFVIDAAGRPTAPLRDASWLPGPHAVERAASADARLGARTRTFQPADGHVIPVTNIVGWGAPTDVACRIVDGAITDFFTLDDGDATVPARSAAWLAGPAVRTWHVPIGIHRGVSNREHSQLWDGRPSRQIMEWVLRDAPRTPYFHVALEPDDVFRLNPIVRIRIVCTDPDGLPLDDGSSPNGAVAAFLPPAHQPTTEFPLDRWGRVQMNFVRHNNPTMGFYLAPIEIRWRHAGAPHRWRFDLKFLERF